MVSWTRIFCSAAGTAVAGPAGTLAGSAVGALLEQMLPYLPKKTSNNSSSDLLKSSLHRVGSSPSP